MQTPGSGDRLPKRGRGRPKKRSTPLTYNKQISKKASQRQKVYKKYYAKQKQQTETAEKLFKRFSTKPNFARKIVQNNWLHLVKVSVLYLFIKYAY